MPQDNQDDNPAVVGRTYHGETSPPITTVAAVAAIQAKQAKHSGKPGAVSIEVYFASKGIDSPILKASMLAYTDLRVAPVEDFDDIFIDHHEGPAQPAEETKR